MRDKNIETCRIVAIIEARMTSSRLPGKVLMEACGKPMLELLIERSQRIRPLDDIVVATTCNATDDPIHELADRLNVACYRGSEVDVLGRVLGAAKTFKANVIVEITGDCPLLDPQLSSQCIKEFFEKEADYACIDCDNTYPLGLSTQIFPTTILNELDLEYSDDPSVREHVSYPIPGQPTRYKIHRMVAPPRFRHPEYILTLDTASDYAFIKSIFENLYPKKKDFGLQDILTFLHENPKLVPAARHV